MPETEVLNKNKRRQIISAADNLFYQKGYEHTSFADIAHEVKISRGNFYYHFKTKDEILNAVIEARLARTKAMLEQWEELNDSAEDRIRCFIHILFRNQSKIMNSGCPVGTLTTELEKLEHSSKEAANDIFVLFRSWLARQFTLLGYKKKSDQLAMHLLARSQGVATLAQSFKDPNFVKQEVELMCDWLHEISNEK